MPPQLFLTGSWWSRFSTFTTSLSHTSPSILGFKMLRLQLNHSLNNRIRRAAAKKKYFGPKKNIQNDQSRNLIEGSNETATITSFTWIKKFSRIFTFSPFNLCFCSDPHCQKMRFESITGSRNILLEYFLLLKGCSNLLHIIPCKGLWLWGAFSVVLSPWTGT